MFIVYIVFIFIIMPTGSILAVPQMGNGSILAVPQMGNGDTNCSAFIQWSNTQQ
jgi:uncharacterized membrane protein (DUF485 family)